MTMTQGSAKAAHDREMATVMFNLKEQRVLEKSLQTLDLEQSYAIRLLDLDNRIVKVKYKKLKEKVSKIQSYLKPDDINELQALESQGKLKPLFGDCSDSAIKIAAASRRLNLSRASNRSGVHSAFPQIHLTSQNRKCKTTDSETDVIEKVHLLNGTSINDRGLSRPWSAFTFNDQSLITISKKHDTNDSVHHDSIDKKPTNKSRSESILTLKSSPAQRSMSAIQHSQFSSHSTVDLRTGLSTAPANYNRSRRFSHVSNDSIESNLGNNMYEERRLCLLEEEMIKAATLDKQTKLFLQNVDTFLQKNIPIPSSQGSNENKLSQRVHSAELSSRDPYASDRPMTYHKRRGVEFSDTPTYFPESNYKEKLMNLWKNMNKCRYLRVSDEKIDLSGINTLVKDQMKMFEKLKQSDRPPLREAWEN